MPADLLSVLVLILLTAAETIERLWGYVVVGIGVAWLLAYGLEKRGNLPFHLRGPAPWATLSAALLGIVSPLPTLGMTPVALQLIGRGLPARAALTFVITSALTNPQMLLLTVGAMGPQFAAAQVVGILLLGWLAGRLFGGQVMHQTEALTGTAGDLPRLHRLGLAEHVGLHFLLGVLLGAALQVLLPLLNATAWPRPQGWLAVPLLGWLGAPLYTCGGTAIPMAADLLATGFPAGAIFVFLLTGPALRGTALAALGMMLPRRARLLCLLSLLLAGGALGCAFEWLWRMTR